MLDRLTELREAMASAGEETSLPPALTAEVVQRGVRLQLASDGEERPANLRHWPYTGRDPRLGGPTYGRQYFPHSG